jgi:hypothetical protein
VNSLLDRTLERQEQKRKLDVEADFVLAYVHAARKPGPLEADLITVPFVREVEALVEVARDLLRRGFRFLMVET